MSSDYTRFTNLKFGRPSERILEIILDVPGKLNALNAAMHTELAEVWRVIDADTSVSAVLIRGAGGAFCAGGDLSMVENNMTDWETLLTSWKEAKNLVYNIINCSKPIVSALEGPVVGAGLTVGLLADISITGRTTRIIDGHTKLGVVAGDHAAIIWPILCGMAKAKYYLLLCETLNGEEAERIGVVSMCVDDDKVLTTALSICEKFVKLPPAAVRMTKYSLNNWLRTAGPTFDASLALEMLGMKGPEVKEGVSALREKRKPSFDPSCPL
jgi:enoyl-CoA hydratase